MPIKLNGATSGSVELDVPAAVGSDLQLTLPTAAGTLDRLERAGNILQVVYNSTSTTVSSSDTTKIDTGLTATITPTSVNSKILVALSHNGCLKTTGNNINAIHLYLYRDSTEIFEFFNSLNYTGTVVETYSAASMHYLDSPSTTSAVTYKTQFRNVLAASYVAVQAGNSVSGITLFEVAA